MSTDSLTSSTAVISRIANGENTSVGTNKPLQAVQGLIQAVLALASQEDFKQVESHFDGDLRLQATINAQEERLRAHQSVIDTLVQDKASIVTKAKENEAVITGLQESCKGLHDQVRQLDESSTKQKETIRKAGLKVKDLQKNLEEQRARTKSLEESLESERKDAQKQGYEMERLRTASTSFSQELEERNKQLAEFESFTWPLDEEDLAVSVERVESLWVRVYQFAESYFMENLPDAILRNGKAWEGLRKPGLFEHRVPLPPTNSLPAKRMRIAVLSTILARSIDEHICLPTYLFGDGLVVRYTLLRQAVINSKHESFCRSVLLSILPEESNEAASARAERVVEEVMGHIKDLLPVDRIEVFGSELRNLVWNAREVWDAIQKARRRFEPDFDSLQFNNIEWQSLGIDGLPTNETGQETTFQGTGDDELLVVFPRLYVVEDDQNPRPVAAGTMLRRSQSLAAAQELDEQSQSPIIGRARSVRRPRRTRNSSVSTQGNNGLGVQPFLG